MDGHSTRRLAAHPAWIACALAVLSGCSGSTGAGGAGAGLKRDLTAADFVAGAGATSGVAAPETPAAARPQTIPVEKASEGIHDAVVLDGPPASPTAAASAGATTPPAGAPASSAAASAGPITSAPGQPEGAGSRVLVVDEVVGQINGKPIYASDFLKDMDARLRANTIKMKRPDWIKDTFAAVRDKLRDEMRDQLLLSEFNTGLKPEQKPGVAAFFTKVQEDLRSGARGSETLADRRLLESEGKTLREKARDIADRAFIQDQLRRMVFARVQVSRREIRRYFENNPNEFRPPQMAVFRVIRVPRSDAARIARVQKALASGESFADVARRESDWRKDAEEGRFLQTIEFRGDYAKAELFGGPLNDAAHGLSVGQVSGQIDLPGSSGGAFWLKLESIESPPAVTFYEAQLAIESKLKNERFREEQTRYFENLLRRSSATNVDKMAQEITAFATDRYWGEGRVQQPGSAPNPRPAGDAPGQ